MKIVETLEYDAPADVVFDMLVDPAYQERKCVDGGAVGHSASVTPQGEGLRVVTMRELPTEHLPDFARSLVGPRLRTTETWEWGAAAADGSREADLRVEVSGAPVTLRGRARLTPSPRSSVLTIEGDLKASVPIVGGRIEKAAAPAVAGAFHGEGDTGRRWLTERA